MKTISELLENFVEGASIEDTARGLEESLPDAEVCVEGESPWQHLVVTREGQALVLDCLASNGGRLRLVDGAGKLVGIHKGITGLLDTPDVHSTPLVALASEIIGFERATPMHPRHLSALRGSTPEDELNAHSVIISRKELAPDIIDKKGQASLLLEGASERQIGL